MDCEFCGKQFSTKGNAVKHQQTAKYCMELQIQKEGKLRTFSCIACDKNLCSKNRLYTHQQVCEKYLQADKIHQLERVIEQNNSVISLKDITISELKSHIKELENKLFDIALKTKAKTTNNSNTYIYQNFTPITDEKLKQEAVNFTRAHLVLGGQGVAKFALEGVLKDNFVCTDVARGHVKYIDSNGDMVLDPGAITIARRVCGSIVEPAEKINLGVKSTLSGTTPDSDLIRAVIIDNTVSDIRHAASGVDNVVTREFVKTISNSNVKKIDME